MKNNWKLKIYQFVTYSCASLSCILGLTVIAGWLVEQHELIQPLPATAPMHLGTAISFCILGLAVIFLLSDKNKVSSALSLTTTAIGLLTLVEHATGLSLGIDHFFVDHYHTANLYYEGKMPFSTAFGILLCGSTSFLASKNIKAIRVAGVLSTFICILGFISLEGYLVSMEKIYAWGLLTVMPVNTSIGFLLTGAGLLSLSWLKETKYNLVASAKTTPWHAGYTVSFLLAVFVLDLSLPLGVAAGTLYVPVILFGWYFKEVRSIFTLAIAVSSLILVGFYFSPVGADFWVVVINRAVSVATIWIVAVQLFHHKRKKIALEVAEELKQAEERFKKVVESSPTSIILVDEGGKIVMSNERTEKLFGYSNQELLGSSLDMLVPAPFRSGHANNRKSFFEAPSSRKMGVGRNLLALRKDGSEIQVEVGLNPITIDNSLMVLATIIDITKQREQEAIIKKQMRELSLKNKDLEQFAYITSHDLQEPLRTVSNYAQIIEEDFRKEMSEELQAYFDKIAMAIGRMRILVRTLLDFSRLGRDRTLEKTDCNLLVNGILDDLSNLIKETNTIIKVNSLPTIMTYDAEFSQLLQNLISNAIKFRKEGVPCEISINCKELEEFWQFEVIDNGIGIDEMNQRRIFDIFQQLHKKGSYEGYGIGLANCKKIVEQHGGEIWVESEIGKGSTFYFTIKNLET